MLLYGDRLRNFMQRHWQKLGRRSLFEVIGAETDHHGLRVHFIDARHGVPKLNATLLSLGFGLNNWLRCLHGAVTQP